MQVDLVRGGFAMMTATMLALQGASRSAGMARNAGQAPLFRRRR